MSRPSGLNNKTCLGTTDHPQGRPACKTLSVRSDDSSRGCTMHMGMRKVKRSRQRGLRPNRGTSTHADSALTLILSGSHSDNILLLRCWRWWHCQWWKKRHHRCMLHQGLLSIVDNMPQMIKSSAVHIKDCLKIALSLELLNTALLSFWLNHSCWLCSEAIIW